MPMEMWMVLLIGLAAFAYGMLLGAGLERHGPRWAVGNPTQLLSPTPKAGPTVDEPGEALAARLVAEQQTKMRLEYPHLMNPADPSDVIL